MNFINSLQCEILKIKGSALLWLSIVGGLLIPIVFTVRFLTIHNYINAWKHPNIWEALFLQVSRPFSGFLLPVGIILICSLITQVEYKNNNWKQVYTTPQSYTTIFLAKYLTLLLLTLLVFTFLNIGVIFLGVIPCLAFDGKLPNETIPFNFFIKETLKAIIISSPVIALQYFISLKYKNFLISIGLGLTLYVGTMIALKLECSYLSPYSYVLFYFDKRLTSGHSVMFFIAIFYFIFLSTINYFFFITKKNKG